MSPRKLIWTTDGDTESAEYLGATASITRVKTDESGTVTLSILTASRDSDDTAAHVRIPANDLEHRLEELREQLEARMMSRARTFKEDDITARFRVSEDSSATTKVFPHKPKDS
jgi:hypothetical protein